MYRLVFVFACICLLVSTVFAQKIPPAPTPAQYAEMEESWETLSSDEDECLGTNLLANPSFEGNYSNYTPVPGHPDCPWGTCASAQMADNWTPYWKSQNPSDPEWIYRMPEWKPAESHFTNPVRVRSGQRAQQWFTFFGTHQAGIFQRVTNITPGASVCLSIWGHSWSSNTDHTYTDPNAHGFLNQQIGIDPTGGTDYLSPNVIWTNPVTQYDEYGLFKLNAVAQADSVTVFFHSEPLWAYKHNDVYWDDAILTVSGGDPASMDVSPLWIGLEAEAGIPETQIESASVIIENAPAMDWSARVLSGSTFAPTLHHQGDELQIEVDNSGLPAGQYRANVEISADDPTIDGGRQYLTVDLTVYPSDPTVVASPGQFAFMTDSAEAVTASTQIAILNATDLITWTATVSPTLRSQEFTIEFFSDTGQSGDTLQFTAFSAGLPVGTYQTTILVEAPAPIIRAEIPVTFVVVEQKFHAFLPAVNR